MRLFRILNSGQILTGTGVDLDFITVVNEQRNVYGCASLNGCRLGSALCGITLEARLGVGDLKLYESRRLYGEYLTIVRADLNDLILLNEL